ncbi:WhiB family transcriptional regulator [Lapillicoccus jejuensis]|uniref:Transcriptional regulator WhiB n=1 Tax=Lapillicoccus jejuensis TaxID=402171 RepID=A0A542E601_9MICO|nr:WhiB family transcriptional regulator [Lapillicoccus jejuensis]TQJ10724.1 WhiB family redox-sensing transcriptional regulator [Lapillicoccus jejuensis]
MSVVGSLTAWRQAAQDDWRELAACAGPESAAVFEAADDDAAPGGRRAWGEPRDALQAARDICGGCPVVRDCLGHALRVPETHGVWGGTTPAEREAILLGIAG